MKRFLVFLLLFAVGLSVLLWVQHRMDTKKREQRIEAPPPIDPGQKPPPTNVEIEEDQTASVVSTGRFSAQSLERPRYAIEAVDHYPTEQDVYEFKTVQVEQYGEEHDDLVLELQAETARAKLEGGSEIGIDDDFPMRLEDVRATVHRDLPFVPLQFEVANLEGVLQEQLFGSDERVTFLGNGLEVRGTGLQLDLGDGSFRLDEQTRSAYVADDGTTAIFNSAGSLWFRKRDPDNPTLEAQPVEIEMRDQARMRVEGDVPVIAQADVIFLYGRPARDDSSRFVPERIRMRGNVRLFTLDGKFFGDKAEIVLDDEGLPLMATLEDNPRAESILRDLSSLNMPVDTETKDEFPVELTGTGPLEVLVRQRGFQMHGPSRLQVSTLGAFMDAQAGIESYVIDDVRSLRGEGGTRMVALDTVVTAEAVTVRGITEGDEIQRVQIQTEGDTRVDGRLRDGSDYALEAEDGLVFERDSEFSYVPVARRIELTVSGEEPFTAQADRLLNLDESAQTCIAEGNVEFENATGKVECDRLDVLGPNEVEFFGSPGKPARYTLRGEEGEEATITARWIRYDGSVLWARDEVVVQFGVEEQSYDLRGHWLELLRSEPDEESRVRIVDVRMGGEVLALLENPRGSARIESELLEARALQAEEGTEPEPLEFDARGNVRFEFKGEQTLKGEGEHLRVNADGSGRLDPVPDERVQFTGELPRGGFAFEMEADSVQFTTKRLVATNPDMEINGVELAFSTNQGEETPLRAVAGKLVCDETSVLFSDGVYLGQVAGDREGWSLDTDRALLTGDLEIGEDALAGPIQELLAWGGFVARFDGTVQARGDSLHANPEYNLVNIVGSPAILSSQSLEWESDWFDFNTVTRSIRSGKGLLSPRIDAEIPWSLAYASLQPIEGQDDTIQIVREPIVVSGDRQLRASWALFWVDPQRLSESDLGARPRPMRDESEEDGRFFSGSLFSLLEGGLSEWLSETYLEGNVELLINGARRARAEAAYLDLVDGHGWVREVSTTMETELDQRQLTFKLRASWMRHSRDGSFAAEDAVLTSCDFDEPHYEIKIGKLSMSPKVRKKRELGTRKGRGEGSGGSSRREPDNADAAESTEPSNEEPEVASAEEGAEEGTETTTESGGWNVNASGNGISFPNGMTLPLPTFQFPLTPDFGIPRQEIRIFGVRPLSVGSDARFGTFVSTQAVRPAGWIARKFDKLLGGDPEVFTGDTSFSASFLDLRGLLFGIENSIRSEGRYFFNTRINVIGDTGEDRGLVRVPEDDRSDFRGWYTSRGRYLLGPKEWIDFVFSKQTDPGVQAEYFEDDYLRFEERETYLHWRKAEGSDFVRAEFEVRLDDFRTEVMEQPTLGYYHGSAPIGEMFGQSVLYTSDSSIDNLKRREGDPDFEDPFPDGLGDRDSFRVNTEHRFEMPVPLHVMNARAVPFVEGIATAWSEAALGDAAPRRAAIRAGVELSTTFSRLYDSDKLHQIIPTIGYRQDLVSTEGGGDQILFDETDLPLEGQFVDIGFRTRFDWLRERDYLDIEVRETWADDVADGAPSGWQPLYINGTYLSSIAGIPVGITHDGRHDIRTGHSPYSRTFFGFQPSPRLALETGYHSGRSETQLLYSAISLGGRYRLSKKWDIEARQTISTRNNNERLFSRLAARRMGHDFILEFEARFRAGEGGTSFGLSLYPVMLWRDPHLGFLDRWLNPR